MKSSRTLALALLSPLLLVGCVADDDPPGEYPIRIAPEPAPADPPTELGPPSTPPPPASYDENVPPNNPSDGGMDMGDMNMGGMK